MNEKNRLAVSRDVKHIKLLGATTLIALLTTQSVYAADSSSTSLNSGVPGWVWLLIGLAIVIGAAILFKKLSGGQNNKKLDAKPIKPMPIAKAPVAKAPVTVVKPQAPKVEAAPVIAPVPAAPVVQTAPQAKIQPEVQPAAPAELDALVEAKQLLAQQRFPQAVGVLNKGLKKNPSRSDLMLALLEIYLKQDDHDAFEAQLEQLQKLDDPFALIQAEELHRQLDRPINVEKSDVLEFGSSKTIVPESEPVPATPTNDYATNGLDFTSAKVQPDDLALETEKATAEPIPTAITPTEHEFSLDDMDLAPPVADKKESAEEVSVKSDLDDFDFSTFDLNPPETPKPTVVEIAPVVAKVELPAIPAIEPEAKTSTNLDTTPLVDLDFNFDDSFAIDEDKPEVTQAEKTSWSTDLLNENFTAPTAPPVEITIGEIIKSDDLSSLEEAFPFLQSVDTFQTRLELARNYITIGEIDSARELLNEVAEQGGSTQQTEARELMAKLAS